MDDGNAAPALGKIVGDLKIERPIVMARKDEARLLELKKKKQIPEELKNQMIVIHSIPFKWM